MVSVSNERSGNMLIATEHSLAALSRGYIDAARQGVNIESPVMMLWTAPPRHESAIEVGAVKAPHDSEEPGLCKRSPLSVSISRSQFSRFMASIAMAR